MLYYYLAYLDVVFFFVIQRFVYIFGVSTQQSKFYHVAVGTIFTCFCCPRL